jgi:hypothetical protein
MMQKTEYFDSNGRCIPNGIASEYHKQTRRYFILEQPKIDYAATYARLVKHLAIQQSITANDFAERAENILEKLRHDPACSNILNGVHVPFMLPKQTSKDIGTLLDSHYINAVKSAFEDTFPNNSFTNHYKDSLNGKLSINKNSRHERLLSEQAEQVIVGYYFPCLMEYSVPAAIEQSSHLPEQFILAGGYDTSAALVGSPDLLLRKEGYPPVLWMAALDTEKTGVGYHFEAYGYNLTFNRKPHFDRVAESWTSGLVVLG